jgi:hypothetical protein
MKPLKTNIRQAIDDYFAQFPDGLDVTAFVLDRIGHADMEQDAKTTRRSLDQAKQEMGRLISAEILPSMFTGVEPLGLVKVDADKWPALVGWVTSYTQHRVGRRKT